MAERPTTEQQRRNNEEEFHVDNLGPDKSDSSYDNGLQKHRFRTGKTEPDSEQACPYLA
jgi:hypothetical protein